MQLEHPLLALLQLHLHSRLNTWLQWIGQRQLQDETRNIKFWNLVHFIFEIWRYISHTKVTYLFPKQIICLTRGRGVYLFCFEFFSPFAKKLQWNKWGAALAKFPVFVFCQPFTLFIQAADLLVARYWWYTSKPLAELSDTTLANISLFQYYLVHLNLEAPGPRFNMWNVFLCIRIPIIKIIKFLRPYYLYNGKCPP